MTDQKLVDELEKALTDEAYDGGMGALSGEEFSELVRTLAVTAAEVVEKAEAPINANREALMDICCTVSEVDATLAAGFRRTGVPEPSAEAWSTEDRREALAEGLRRWSVQVQHDRVEQRDHNLYGMGARQGFALGAEWWKSTHVTTEPQGEPSDAQVQAVAAALDVHRWKTMGVASVECECGEVLGLDLVSTGDEIEDATLQAFPADAAFRAHVARAALRAAGGVR